MLHEKNDSTPSEPGYYWARLRFHPPHDGWKRCEWGMPSANGGACGECGHAYDDGHDAGCAMDLLIVAIEDREPTPTPPVQP